jgi:hypothetical protein
VTELSTSVATVARFLLRAETTFGRRLLLLSGGAMACFAWRGPVSLWAIDGFLALLLALSTSMGREERRHGLAYLATLPVSPVRVAVASVGLDLAAAAAVTVASAVSGRFALEGALAFLLAVLWGIGWSRVRSDRWTPVWCAVSFVATLAIVHAGGVVALVLVGLALTAWLLVDASRGASSDHHASLESELPAGATAPPLWGPTTLTLGGPGDLLMVAWSGLMTLASIYWAPIVFLAIAPLAMAVVSASLVAARMCGPAREFLLTRPIGRLRYHLAPIAFGLCVTLAPPLAELATASFRGEAALANDIHLVMCSPGTLGEQPRSDDPMAWNDFYARGLRGQMSLAALPPDALERNPDPKASWRYLPSANLRAAVRAAWQARQLRIALMTIAAFLAFLWFSTTSSAPPDGWGERVRWATRWSVRSMGQVTVLPLLLAVRHPEWLLTPTWLLLPAVVLTALGLGRALVNLEVA